ncbi:MULTISPECIES: cupredoxin domain-containing protein [Thalassospira]|uniref:Copper-binding protein n=1 Tax=Thalassospira lohafexi TaxID=744227 RepID=A0A2N3L1E4_9PROT|nr:MULTISPECIES: plastocyanin/azurin family copper-binding protein [Thalassospira]PKR56546.1 copper-binding protein [Thalassospira lohafexi]RCK23803.1 copper-binding protein [Thalassospira lucentensis MCCC 1A00383 = DSM 14000]
MPNFKNSLMRRVSVSTFILGALVGLQSPAFAGAGHSGGHNDGASEIGAPGEISDVRRTIRITMEDNFYDKEKIIVRGGETVRFVIENKGEFVHEFNIGTAAMHAGHQEEMMMMMEHGALEADKINMDMMEMDMGNGMTMKHDDPNSVLLEPGKSAEVIWTFPKDAELEYACNVPGHYESGMVGKVRLQ